MKYRCKKAQPVGPVPTQKLLDEGFFRYVKYPVPGRCPVFRCTHVSRGDRSLCCRHAMQRWRAAHPDTAGFHALRSHAVARGIKFTLVLEDYTEVIDAYEHTKPVLYYRDTLSIDRIDPRKGYEPGNIQGMTVSENASKGNRLRHTPEGRYYQAMAEAAAQEPDSAAETILEVDEDEDDAPF